MPRYRFDLTASDFTIEALRIAPSCPVLCYSILAVSSFYRCIQTSQDDGRADMFHQKAISLLSTLMRDPAQLADGTGLAAVVILRLYEESKGTSDTILTTSWNSLFPASQLSMNTSC